VVVGGGGGLYYGGRWVLFAASLRFHVMLYDMSRGRKVF